MCWKMDNEILQSLVKYILHTSFLQAGAKH